MKFNNKIRPLIVLLVIVFIFSIPTGCSKTDKNVPEAVTPTIEATVAVTIAATATNAPVTEAIQETATPAPTAIATVTEAAPTDASQTDDTQNDTIDGEAPIVYMTTDISSESLVAIYKALGREVIGKVGIKLSMGEPGGNYYLSPDLIKELVLSVDGTFVDSNTAYGGGRANTAMHLQAAEDHGFMEYAEVDILDADGTMSIPVTDGTHLTEDVVGSHFENYDSYIILSHFKGHTMGGFGGAIKNMSIGFASTSGKGLIHTAGLSTSIRWNEDQDDFLESMAEAAKAIADYMGEDIIYISVMNNLSVDCDCDSSPAKPSMADIGILASLDPVALDQACVDLVYAAPDGEKLIERIESRNGLLTLSHAEEIGLGSKTYELVSIDD